MGIDNQEVSRSEAYCFVLVLECSDTCSGCITLLSLEGVDNEKIMVSVIVRPSKNTVL